MWMITLDRGLLPKDYQQEMGYGESNGHVTDDVKGQTRDPQYAKSAISHTAGDPS